jgi:hypothetical protein
MAHDAILPVLHIIMSTGVFPSHDVVTRILWPVRARLAGLDPVPRLNDPAATALMLARTSDAEMFLTRMARGELCQHPCFALLHAIVTAPVLPPDMPASTEYVLRVRCCLQALNVLECHGQYDADCDWSVMPAEYVTGAHARLTQLEKICANIRVALPPALHESLVRVRALERELARQPPLNALPDHVRLFHTLMRTVPPLRQTWTAKCNFRDARFLAVWTARRQFLATRKANKQCQRFKCHSHTHDGRVKCRRCGNPPRNKSCSTCHRVFKMYDAVCSRCRMQAKQAAAQ